MWDYLARFFPEGNADENTNIFFQDEEVEKVYHMGYNSKAENKMQEILNKNS